MKEFLDMLKNFLESGDEGAECSELPFNPDVYEKKLVEQRDQFFSIMTAHMGSAQRQSRELWGGDVEVLLVIVPLSPIVCTEHGGHIPFGPLIADSFGNGKVQKLHIAKCIAESADMEPSAEHSIPRDTSRFN